MSKSSDREARALRSSMCQFRQGNGFVDGFLLTCLGPVTRRSSCKDVDRTGSPSFASVSDDRRSCGKVMEEAYLVILVLKQRPNVRVIVKLLSRCDISKER